MFDAYTLWVPVKNKVLLVEYCELLREPYFTVNQYCECPWKMWPQWILWALARAVLHGQYCECPWKMCFTSNTVSSCESRPSRTIYSGTSKLRTPLGLRRTVLYREVSWFVRSVRIEYCHLGLNFCVLNSEVSSIVRCPLREVLLYCECLWKMCTTVNTVTSGEWVKMCITVYSKLWSLREMSFEMTACCPRFCFWKSVKSLFCPTHQNLSSCPRFCCEKVWSLPFWPTVQY